MNHYLTPVSISYVAAFVAFVLFGGLLVCVSVPQIGDRFFIRKSDHALKEGRGVGLARPLVTLWAQNRPYLDKFEAPEPLDRSIRILEWRRIFLAIVRNQLI